MANTKTIGLTGRDYSTLAAYASYLNGLGSLSDDQIGECYKDSGAIADTSAITFAGVTKNGHTLTLRAATGESFRDHASVQTNALNWNASNGAALTNSATAFSSTILELTGLDVVSGLQFKGSASGYIGHFVKANGSAIDNCIFHRTATKINVYCVYFAASLTNSLILSGWAGFRSDSICTLTDVTIAGYNNAAGGSGALFAHHSNSVLKNVVVRGFTTDYSGTCSGSSTNNATDKGSFGGTNFGTGGQVSVTGAEWASVTAGSEDFRLASGSTKLKDNGATTGPTNDIAGTTRPQGSSYDIGCWELVASGAVNLAATAIAQSTATATLSKSVPLSGAALSIAAATAGMSLSVPLAATAQAQALADGTLTVTVGFAADAVANAAATAVLSIAKPLAAAAQAQAAGTASASIIKGFAASAFGQASSSAELSLAKMLQANAQAQAAATAALDVSGGGVVDLAAGAQAVASSTASITLAVHLSADALAQAMATADLSGSASLAAGAIAQAQASAGLSVDKPLGAAAQAQASAGATLWLQVELSANAMAAASAGAALSLTIPLSAAAIATANASAALSGPVALAADGVAVASATASLTVNTGGVVAAGAQVWRPLFLRRDWPPPRQGRGWPLNVR